MPAQVADTDNDGMPDDWEIEKNLDPTINDAGENPDEDGFSNLKQQLAGTNPHSLNSFPSLNERKYYPAINLLLNDN